MSQSRLAALYRDTQADLRRLAEGVSLGYRTPREFGDAAAELLEERHTQAVVIGRQHAGDTAPEEADDFAFAADVVDEQSEFLAGFVRDLESGRYDDAPEALVARAESYANRLVGTANEALTLASDGDTLWHWRLGSEARSCPDCPTLARNGPYRTADLPAYPGSGSGMQCKTSCRCRLERADGLSGFTLPEPG